MAAADSVSASGGRVVVRAGGEGIMIKLYHAQLTRSVRILWLLEELGLPYEVVNVPFSPPSPTTGYSQATPAGKFPAIQDGDLVMFESGAILEYILERYGKGRLAPAPGTSARGTFLQWVHFAEATIFPPLGQIAFNTLFKPEADRIPAAVTDARAIAAGSMRVLERALDGKDYLLGAEFSGADIMMGYSLMTANFLGVLTDEYPNVGAYFARLQSRPAFQKAMAAG
jgi:glutathione S-transferase